MITTSLENTKIFKDSQVVYLGLGVCEKVKILGIRYLWTWTDVPIKNLEYADVRNCYFSKFH